MAIVAIVVDYHETEITKDSLINGAINSERDLARNLRRVKDRQVGPNAQFPRSLKKKHDQLPERKVSYIMGGCHRIGERRQHSEYGVCTANH